MSYFFALVLLLVVLAADAILGLVVWLQDSRKKVNRIFALITLSFMFWGATGFYVQGASHSDSLFSDMVGAPFVAAIFIGYFLTLFSLYFPETHLSAPSTRRIVIVVLNMIALPLLVIFFLNSKLIIAGVTASSAHGNSTILGPLYWIFPFYALSCAVFSLGNLLIKSRRSQHRREKLQVGYVFIGFFAFSLVAILNNIVIPVITNNHSFARFGFLATLFIIGFIGYAIAAHRLFNIRPIIARSVAYLLLLSTFIGTYSLALLAISGSFFDFTISTAEASIFVGLAVVLAATFHPMRRFFEKSTDRIFYRDRYDSQEILNNVGNVLASELLLDSLLERSLLEICGYMRIAGGQFVIFDQDRVYKEIHFGVSPRKLITTVEAAHLHSGMLITDELETGLRKTLLEDHGIRASLMLQTKGHVVGYLFLSDKLSGEVYSKQDVTVLEILRKELAVAIVNAKAYEEISNFNATLQERIRQATQRLRTANANLRVLDKAKDDFISMASHQLGTPLTAINGYLSMALDNDRGNMTIEQREFVNFALEAAERMTDMSLDLLNVSRLNSGRFIIQRESVDLDRMIQQEIQQLRPSADRKGIKLHYAPPQPSLPRVSADLSKTRQVIMNLIDNAIYYTPAGSITITLRQEADEAVFAVTDTGIGVPADECERLFAKFYRAENARAARPDGTGLGLYLAKQVIEDQGGSIIFESTEGQGSTFGFRLPMNPADSSIKTSGGLLRSQ